MTQPADEPTFDVFLCHNSQDKPAVEEIGRRLAERGVTPWLDKWDLPPGRPWLPELERLIKKVRSVAVFVGPSGFGPWQQQEQAAFLREFVSRGCPVIPVILGGVEIEKTPELPVFLAGMTWVDFRTADPDPLDRLIWGITGDKPQRPARPPTRFGPLALREPVRDFTGREDELQRLRDEITTGATIAGARGLGGVGKTELALKLAAELAPQYPDAQLMIDLRGASTEPLATEEAMRRILQTLLPTARLPDDPDTLAGLYRQQLGAMRGLLLLDNARDAAQVRPLVPPASWLLLVTTRHRFALPGLVLQDLDVLTPAAARQLLLKIAPRLAASADRGRRAGTAGGIEEGPAGPSGATVDDRIEDILRRCAYLPLAVRLAGGVLAERPDMSAERYARRLAERTERLAELNEVLASIGLSYDELDAPGRQRLAELAVFSAPFDMPAAAAVWAVDQREADRTLGVLLRLGLADWEEATARYTLHDLVRDFAHQRLETAGPESAWRRYAEYCLGVLWECHNLYLKGGDQMQGSVSRFDAAYPHIQAAFAWCRSQPDDPAALRLVKEFPYVGVYLLLLRQDPRERVRWLDSGVAAARRLGDRQGEGNALGNLGLAYADLGETRRAIEYHEQSLAIAREIGNRLDEGKALGNLGLAYADLGETRRAIETYEQRLPIAREIGDRRGEGAALGNLGNAYADLGETRRAIECHEKYLAIAREIGDRRGEGIALGNLGLAYAALGETRRAIEFHEQNVAIAREIGDRRGEANASWNLGLALETQGELARAADLMQVRVDYLRELGHPDAEKHAASVAAMRAKIAGN